MVKEQKAVRKSGFSYLNYDVFKKIEIFKT